MDQEKVFFDFLKFSVGVSSDVPATIADADWQYIYDTARKQTITGVLFRGIEMLPEKYGPGLDLLMRWMAEVRQIETTNKKVDKAAAHVSRWFLSKGYRSCILKGQGNALMYPNPARRMSGDIDIWLEGKPRDIIKMVHSIDKKARAIYHHIDFPDYKGTPIEVHYRPRFLQCPIYNRYMQRWFISHADKQFSNTVAMGGGTVCVPTTEFNIVLQTGHIYGHLFQEGIGLRQLIDFYYLLLQVREAEIDIPMLCRDMKRMGLYKFACALMFIMNVVFGATGDMLIFPIDKRRGEFVLNEVLVGGNFGKYDKRYGFSKTAVGRNLQRLWRDLRMLRYFPEESICEPFFRLWHFGWRLVNDA